MVDDDGFDDLIDMGLTGDLVLSVGGGHEGGPKADGQIIGVHHILIAVLGQAVRQKIEQSGHLARFKKWTIPLFSLNSCTVICLLLHIICGKNMIDIDLLVVLVATFYL